MGRRASRCRYSQMIFETVNEDGHPGESPALQPSMNIAAGKTITSVWILSHRRGPSRNGNGMRISTLLYPRMNGDRGLYRGQRDFLLMEGQRKVV